MKILVTGAKGQLGWELMQRGAQPPFTVMGVDLPEVDLCEDAQVAQIFQETRPELVINAAAYTNVDGAQSEREICYQVNEAVPRRLAAACRRAGIPLIHISTDFVFHAAGTTPWKESDPVSPRGVYAESKAAGEAAVRAELTEHFIVRTAWLYGIRGKNFVKTMLTLARDREEIGVVADQVGCPTFAGDLAQTLLAMATRLGSGPELAWGTYHYCGGGSTTWHGLAEAAIDLARRRSQVAFKLERLKALTTAEYPTLAVRPAYSVLDCSKIKKTLGIGIPTWESVLEAVIDDLIDAWEAGQ
ncbi:MAG: dTDP-4-dehydrorhamnose reductase [Desulfosarcinaceae bacterium]|jgi:dTDP-4-dehydrorhamnose reductase